MLPLESTLTRARTGSAALAVALGLGIAVLLSCSQPAGESQGGTAREEPPRLLESLAPHAFDAAAAVVGQTVYVPCYSQVFSQASGRGAQRIPFAISLSLRNTDADHPIVIRSVRYYASDGSLVRDFTPAGPVAIGPLGTVTQPVAKLDLAAGEGANFLVEWAAAARVSQPIFEAVMLSSAGTSAMAFSTRGEMVETR